MHGIADSHSQSALVPNRSRPFLLRWVRMLKFCVPYLPCLPCYLSCAKVSEDVEEVKNGIRVLVGIGSVATKESSGFPVQSAN